MQDLAVERLICIHGGIFVASLNYFKVNYVKIYQLHRYIFALSSLLFDWWEFCYFKCCYASFKYAIHFCTFCFQVLGRVKCQIKDVRKGIKETGIWPLFSQRLDSQHIVFPRESAMDITPQVCIGYLYFRNSQKHTILCVTDYIFTD